MSPWLLKLQIAMARAVDIDLRITSLSYFGLLTATVVAMGAIFEMPPVVFILSRIGLVSAGFLARNFKYAFLLFALAFLCLTLLHLLSLTYQILQLYPKPFSV